MTVVSSRSLLALTAAAAAAPGSWDNKERRGRCLDDPFFLEFAWRERSGCLCLRLSWRRRRANWWRASSETILAPDDDDDLPEQKVVAFCKARAMGGKKCEKHAIEGHIVCSAHLREEQVLMWARWRRPFDSKGDPLCAATAVYQKHRADDYRGPREGSRDSGPWRQAFHYRSPASDNVHDLNLCAVWSAA